MAEAIYNRYLSLAGLDYDYFYNRLYPFPLVDCASKYPMDNARERK